jgi:hypothetical protein
MSSNEEAKKEAIIRAIRSDHLVGRGTCSSVDECHTEAELIERFGRTPTGRLTSPAQALKRARADERLYREIFDDIAGTAF